MILLWGIDDDGPLGAVRRVLDRRGLQCAFLDQRAVLKTEIELVVDAGVAGFIRTGDQRIDLCAVTAAYLRPHDIRCVPALACARRGSAAWRQAVNLEDTLWSWAQLTPAFVVNRPSAMASNASKPYQAALIRSCGFETPQTLLTTDPQAALEFWSRCGTVIYKSVSGVRSIVSRVSPRHLARLETVAWCPTQFQQYVPGTDYRVHVVGDDVFACEINSQADDYRYAERQGVSREIRPCDLSPDLARQCRDLAARLGLVVAGVDLRQTPDGAWYCFEVNPSPGFTFFQGQAGQCIDEAVANLLIAASQNVDPPSVSGLTQTPTPGSFSESLRGRQPTIPSEAQGGES